jgi:hypothetical protein
MKQSGYNQMALMLQIGYKLIGMLQTVDLERLKKNCSRTNSYGSTCTSKANPAQPLNRNPGRKSLQNALL